MRELHISPNFQLQNCLSNSSFFFFQTLVIYCFSLILTSCCAVRKHQAHQRKKKKKTKSKTKPNSTIFNTQFTFSSSLQLLPFGVDLRLHTARLYYS